MKTPRFWIPAIVLTLASAPAALHAQPSGAAFTYQGQLKEAGVPCEGAYDFIFQLWDAAEGGAMVSDELYVDDWPVGAGLFTVQLDFGEGMFTGDERWLQMHVRPGDSSGSYTELSPRQPLTATPYALYALSGPGSGGFWAASGDDIYNTNSGNVGIGTTDPGYPLHVESDGTRIVYVRNNAASGRALYASSNGTALYAEGGSCGLDAYTDSPTGIGISVFNEAESGNAYAVYANNISPTGVAIYGRTSNGNDYAAGIGVYGHAANDGYVTAGIGVYGRSESDHGGAGVYGEATATGGESAYGVHGVSTSNAGVRGENSDSGNYGILGSGQYGVYGRGNSAGGYFEDSNGSGYAYVGYSARGIEGHGATAGGYFADTDGTGYAYVGHGTLGISAFGGGAGGYFEDTDGSGYAYVGYGDRGLEARGTDAGGYFSDSDGSGEAYVGSGDEGIRAYGTLSGGYFADTDGSGYARVGHGDDGIRGFGTNAGGLFQDYDDSGYAYVGSGDEGIRAYGTLSGGYFADTDGSGYARVGFGNLGIGAYGSEAGGRFENTIDGSITYLADSLNGSGISAYGQGAGGYFEDQDGSSHAFVAYGDHGIEATGTEAGGYFRDTEGLGYAYVGRNDRGIEGYGLTGGYFESADANGYAYVGSGPIGIWAYGRDTGGYFEDTNSGTWSRVAVGSDKISSNGSCDFVQNHPEDPGAAIVYACPEGGEVATYTRGTARLQNGLARVPLGDTFKWVTNPDIGLTAHLTPRGDCNSLYVEALGTSEMIVRELRGGTSNVTFDYIVYGLRIGFEEVSIVQEKTREAYIPSMEDHRALYERRPELRDYNALERFKRMRADIGETRPLDLSASQALHDAIVEFDPDIHSIEQPHGPRTEHILGADGDAEHGPAPSSEVGPVDIPERSLPESLPEIVNHKAAEIEALRAECAARQQRIEALETRLTRLEALLNAPSGQ
jgi:hypothetical protein